MFSRSESLLGAERMARIASAKVAVVGIGGVGGWCAEALARTGVGALALIDGDTVQPSNINRQAAANSRTLGMKKVEAMKARLEEINPACKIEARFERIEDYRGPWDFDAIVDAIDSMDAKAALLLEAADRGIPAASSMGAALRTDPGRVALRRFDKIAGDAVAKALRRRFKALGRQPARKFFCAVSDEPPARIEERGSIMPVTATFGMVLAAHVLDIIGGGKDTGGEDEP